MPMQEHVFTLSAIYEFTEIAKILSEVDTRFGMHSYHKVIVWINVFIHHNTEKDDYTILIGECISLCAQWEEIAGILGLQPSLIASIKENHPNDNVGCWNDALMEWTSQNYHTEKFGLPSWKTFLTAVAKVDKMQCMNLAAKHQGSYIYLLIC